MYFSFNRSGCLVEWEDKMNRDEKQIKRLEMRKISNTMKERGICPPIARLGK